MNGTADGAWKLKAERPAVYLDQWVWIRLAQAAAGRPQKSTDYGVLTAVRAAAAAGIAFPLSSTHYFETSRIKDPRQRRDLANVMGPISRFLNLRSRHDLVKHQMLTAMHEIVGRPYFRPAPVTILDLGAVWAIRGTVVLPKI